jgi:hypothetical protein
MINSRSLCKICLLIGAVLLCLLPSIVGAYINGGDWLTDFREQKAKVEAGGWHATFAGDFPNQNQLLVTFYPDSDPPSSFDRFVKLIVARAIAELPADQVARFSTEHRDHLVILAKEWLTTAKRKPPSEPAIHTLGPFQSKLGATKVRTWWATGRKTQAETTNDLFYLAITLEEPASATSPSNMERAP